MQHETRSVGKAFTQHRGEVAVDLNRLQPASGIQQAFCQRSAARTNLYRLVSRLEIDRGDDTGDDGRIVQKMLAKALAGGASGVVQTLSSQLVICAASSIAATRLPASALPVPARSSAVP